MRAGSAKQPGRRKDRDRILHRGHEWLLAWCDSVAGDLIRAQRTTGRRYEREHPGVLIHIDVKKLGRMSDGGVWQVLGREATVAHKYKKIRTGFDYTHAVIDDHSRLTYTEVLPDEKGATVAAFSSGS